MSRRRTISPPNADAYGRLELLRHRMPVLSLGRNSVIY
jgi:hypothetical protein